MEKAKAALDAGQITDEEFKTFKESLKKDDEDAASSLELSKNKFRFKEEAASEKSGIAKSLEGGSADLYLAMVKNSTASYQTKMQTTTDRMYDVQLEALNETRQMNYYLSPMATQTPDDYSVWG